MMYACGPCGSFCTTCSVGDKIGAYGMPTYNHETVPYFTDPEGVTYIRKGQPTRKDSRIPSACNFDKCPKGT